MILRKNVVLMLFYLLDPNSKLYSHAWSSATHSITSFKKVRNNKKYRQRPSKRMFLRMYKNTNSGGEEHTDPSALGDWRKFRADLISSGIRTSDEPVSKEKSPLASSARHKTVSLANESILASQNPALALEYMEENWAHTVPLPEIGGLICRMPIELELYRHHIFFLEQNSDANTQCSKIGPFTKASSLLRTMLSDSVIKDNNTALELSRNAGKMSNVASWFRITGVVIQKEVDRISSSSAGLGQKQIQIDKLRVQDRKFMSSYVDYQNKWQEVALVSAYNETSGAFSTITINRPLSEVISSPLAQLILFGTNTTASRCDQGLLIKFLIAFEQKAGVYIGGPNFQELPATMIHGIHDLEGAREISPGTGIYSGGIAAAVDGVMLKKYDPLEFRFCIGTSSYQKQDLVREIKEWKYVAVACARPVALKHSIGLSKPLWHESE
uniref:Uncharacterized protein n=1 Tax=Corethron hystrix TaxID=216773 RepID=A0A7S1FXM8_9STRA|mmetsp:Transcript_36402/g.85104  ORF Transcript_36402/g.85104 Transcript_36402/m.85104 type:complete len:441 (+) Transcript_36402:260-1582(+)